MKDDRLYLVHIRECIERIEEYTSGGREEFVASRLIQDAVVRNLQIMAESTQRLSDDIRVVNPDIDWRGIAGFRNVVVYDYLGLDVNRVWQVVERDLPKLMGQVATLLKRIEKQPEQ
jgi:uncharacterized protein with HEPN domain